LAGCAHLVHDFGVPGRDKKKLESDLDEIDATGRTTSWYYKRISLARIINKLAGGAVIAPWDVDNLSEDWLDAFRMLDADSESRAKVKAALQAQKANWLSRFKHYKN
jgi:hypothetical protein